MRRSLCFRIDQSLFFELQKIVKSKKISLSVALRELLKKGLENLKQIENGNHDEMNNQHLEIGTSSSIEALLLLRKVVKQTNLNG